MKKGHHLQSHSTNRPLPGYEEVALWYNLMRMWSHKDCRAQPTWISRKVKSRISSSQWKDHVQQFAYAVDLHFFTSFMCLSWSFQQWFIFSILKSDRQVWLWWLYSILLPTWPCEATIPWIAIEVWTFACSFSLWRSHRTGLPSRSILYTHTSSSSDLLNEVKLTQIAVGADPFCSLVICYRWISLHEMTLTDSVIRAYPFAQELRSLYST